MFSKQKLKHIPKYSWFKPHRQMGHKGLPVYFMCSFNQNMRSIRVIFFSSKFEHRIFCLGLNTRVQMIESIQCAFFTQIIKQCTVLRQISHLEQWFRGKSVFRYKVRTLLICEVHVYNQSLLTRKSLQIIHGPMPSDQLILRQLTVCRA